MRRIIVWTTLVVCLLTLSSLSATAQTTIDPTRAQFTASPDHSATLPDSTPVVQSYRIEFYLSGASAPFQTADLGKPTPDGTNTITVGLTSIFVGWPLPGTIYESDVAAVGPGGSGASTRSNTFTFSTQCTATVAPLTFNASGSGGTARGTRSVRRA